MSSTLPHTGHEVADIRVPSSSRPSTHSEKRASSKRSPQSKKSNGGKLLVLRSTVAVPGVVAGAVPDEEVNSGQEFTDNRTASGHSNLSETRALDQSYPKSRKSNGATLVLSSVEGSVQPGAISVPGVGAVSEANSGDEESTVDLERNDNEPESEPEPTPPAVVPDAFLIDDDAEEERFRQAEEGGRQQILRNAAIAVVVPVPPDQPEDPNKSQEIEEKKESAKMEEPEAAKNWKKAWAVLGLLALIACAVAAIVVGIVIATKPSESDQKLSTPVATVAPTVSPPTQIHPTPISTAVPTAFPSTRLPTLVPTVSPTPKSSTPLPTMVPTNSSMSIPSTPLQTLSPTNSSAVIPFTPLPTMAPTNASTPRPSTTLPAPTPTVTPTPKPSTALPAALIPTNLPTTPSTPPPAAPVPTDSSTQQVVSTPVPTVAPTPFHPPRNDDCSGAQEITYLNQTILNNGGVQYSGISDLYYGSTVGATIPNYGVLDFHFEANSPGVWYTLNDGMSGFTVSVDFCSSPANRVFQPNMRILQGATCDQLEMVSGIHSNCENDYSLSKYTWDTRASAIYFVVVYGTSGTNTTGDFVLKVTSTNNG